MPYYEVLCLASGRLARQELSDLLRKTCRAFMDQGGIVTRIAPMGANGFGPRKLAYRIRKNQVSYETGFFVNVCAFATPDILTEVERRLKLDERVLRHKTLKKTLKHMAEDSPDMDEQIEDTGLTENDPEFAMRKFVEEHSREFPDGQRFEDRQRPEQTDREQSVRAVMENLKAATMQEAGDPGLRWLSDAKLQDPSFCPRTGPK